jgi:hypothetical protein
MSVYIRKPNQQSPAKKRILSGRRRPRNKAMMGGERRANPLVDVADVDAMN